MPRGRPLSSQRRSLRQQTVASTQAAAGIPPLPAMFVVEMPVCMVEGVAVVVDQHSYPIDAWG